MKSALFLLAFLSTRAFAARSLSFSYSGGTYGSTAGVIRSECNLNLQLVGSEPQHVQVKFSFFEMGAPAATAMAISVQGPPGCAASSPAHPTVAPVAFGNGNKPQSAFTVTLTPTCPTSWTRAEFSNSAGGGMPSCEALLTIREDRGAIRAFSHIYNFAQSASIFLTVPNLVNGGRPF